MTGRKEFEAWAISDGGYHRSVPMHKDFTGEYIDGDLNEAWETWQAAIASQSAELAALRADEKRAVPEGWQQVAHLFRGVRVEGNTVIISVKGGNEAARLLCGELILLMLAAAPLPKEQT